MRALRLLLLLASVGVLSAAWAQVVPPIVVSEYFNTSPEPVEEWTELLVVQDTLDLRGYILTDNNQTQTQPQGGVRFANHPLWQRLRAGTIIVINHRGSQVVDADARDGYIEIGAQNTTYFEQIRLDSNPGLRWEDVALNIALQGDIVQILSPSGQHVHALGHRDTPGPYFQALPPPKVHYNGTCPNPGSVRVVPGLSLAAYAAGAGTDSAIALGTDVTKGLPNQSPAHRDRNQLLWRWLRQPRWNAPQVLRLQLSSAGVWLEWSAAEDPAPGDSLQGYIVVRDTAGSRSIPRDGRTYRVGERIGTGLVVAQVYGRQALDTFPLPCGARVVYRIYAFRYREDDRLGNDPGELLARGRSYTEESFAEITVEKPLPALPRISASAQQVCAGESVRLWVDSVEPSGEYRWLRNGEPIAGATGPEYIARVSGRYAVEFRDTLGCSVRSAEVEITVHPLPSIAVAPARDTALCPGDTLRLRAYGAARYRWYRDGTLVGSAAELAVTQPAEYWVVGENEFGCRDSVRVRVRSRQPVLVAVPDTLQFGTLTECQGAVEGTLVLRNLGPEPVWVYRPTLPPGFSVVGQSFPFEIAPGAQHSVRIRFRPATAGTYGGIGQFRLEPCGASLAVYLAGAKRGGAVVASAEEVDFGRTAACLQTPVDTVVWLTNRGDAPVEVRELAAAAPFAVVAPAVLPVALAPGERLAVQVRYIPTGPGLRQGQLRAVLQSGVCQDTLSLELRAIAAVPRLQLSPQRVNFPAVSGCQLQLDTVVQLANVGELPLGIALLLPPEVAVQGVPARVEPGESFSVRLRVNPAGTGNFAYRVGFAPQPCGDTLWLELSGVAEGVVARLERAAVQFGTVLVCAFPDTLELPVRFTTSVAQGVELLELQAQGDQEAFSLSWRVGEWLRDGALVQVRFHPPRPGQYSMRVQYVLRADTCRLQQELQLAGEALGMALEVSPDMLDFGRVAAGEQVRRRVWVRNPLPLPVELAQPQGIAPPFALLSPQSFPVRLEPGEGVIFELLYAPQDAPRRDTLPLVLLAQQPCPYRVELTFVGEAVGGPPAVLRAQLVAGDVRAVPGTLVRVPIRAWAQDAAALQGIRTLQLRIRYDRRLLELQQVQSPMLLSWSEPEPGELHVHLGSPAGLPSGTVAELVGIALWHPIRRAPVELLLDSLGTETPVQLTLSAGMLELQGVCDRWGRQLRPAEAPRVQVFGQECPQLQVSLEGDAVQPVQLWLFDVLGRQIARWELVPAAERSAWQIALPCQQLAAGLYWIAVCSGGECRRVPIPVSR
jgi:hypothetical protein